MNILELIMTISGVGAVMYYSLIRVPREQKKRFKMKVQELDKFYAITNKLQANTNIERTLIWRSENGGGVPRFGFQINLSAVYENYDPPFSSVKADYQELKADDKFVSLLSKMYDQEFTAMYTADMPGGMIRDMNIRDGVTWSYFFKIGGDRTAFYFGQFDTSIQQTPFQSNQGTDVHIAVNEIRKKYKKLNESTLRRIREKLYL